jgi:dTDP-4-dehydrorhamnose reductase
MLNILVTGSKGQLGSEIRLISSLYPGYSFQFIDIEELNLTKKEQTDKFFKTCRPDIIINCAAYTAVDQAEHDRETASQLNAEWPETLASISQRDHSLIIHYSTDYVFDGKDYHPYTETHPPDPQCFYGKTKLDGENAILINAFNAVIIRTSWLYSSFGKNFVKTIIDKGRQTKQLRVVCDQIGSPTYAFDLAKTTLDLIPQFKGLNQHEIFHYANEGVCSWYDFAIAILKIAKVDCAVEAVGTREYPTPAVRPPYSVLDKSKIKGMGVTIPYWKDSLEKCILQILENKS